MLNLIRNAAACAALAIVAASHAGAHDLRETVTPNFAHPLPDVPGKVMKVVVVDYAPGAASAPHLHAKSAFIYAYVVSGSIESQVDDGPRRIYRAGESFHERPGSTHRVSRNASDKEPAKLLAVFVLDSDEQILTTDLR